MNETQIVVMLAKEKRVNQLVYLFGIRTYPLVLQHGCRGR
jgi:hypothetical protein